MTNDDSKQESPYYRWIILAIMWSTTFISVYAQFQVSALAYKIIPDLNLTSGNFAMVLLSPMLPAVFFSIVAGALADRFGVKRVVAVSFVFSIIGTYYRYLATDFWSFFLLMFLSGFSVALLNANVSKLVGAWFPRKQIGTAMGIYFSALGFGMGATLITASFFSTVKSAYTTAGLIMIVVFILWMIFIKNKPDGAPELPSQPVLKYIRIAAKSKSIWLAGLALMCFMGANMAFLGFLPNALTQARGIEPGQAGIMAAMVTLGTILGNIIGPYMADRIGRMKPFLSPVAFLGAILMFASWMTQGISMWAILLLLGICLGISTPLLMAFPMLLPEIGPIYAGSAGGLLATLQLIGAFFIPSIIIAPLGGDNYTILFGLSSLFLLLLGIVALFLPELGTKASKEA
ncbi:MAG: MFS transporter [Desulfitibacter sp. BRH_c19]|nr:MAG: MFS transporter [Desulfitibacter sp. BRH_c19]